MNSRKEQEEAMKTPRTGDYSECDADYGHFAQPKRSERKKHEIRFELWETRDQSLCPG